MSKVNEILGEKVYHSIGHMPDSRLGPGDHHIDKGQVKFFTHHWPDRFHRIAVQEKVDGTSVAVVRTEDEVIPVIRAGWRADQSRREMHHHFAKWAYRRKDLFYEMLAPGERLCGEWLMQAHSIVYDQLPSPFLAFDLKLGDHWASVIDLMQRCAKYDIHTVPLISYGLPVDPQYYDRLSRRSAFRSRGPAEGLVFRREVKGKRLEIAKWVRKDHEPGILMKGDPVWLFKEDEI